MCYHSGQRLRHRVVQPSLRMLAEWGNELLCRCASRSFFVIDMADELFPHFHELYKRDASRCFAVGLTVTLSSTQTPTIMMAALTEKSPAVADGPADITEEPRESSREGSWIRLMTALRWYSRDTPSEEKNLVLRLDLLILIFGCLCFFTKYLDQSSLTNAYVRYVALLPGQSFKLTRPAA